MPRHLTRPRPALALPSASTLVGLAVAASAAGGALAGCRPTALSASDALLAAGLAAGAAWMASVARRWTWPWVAGAAAVVTVGETVPFALALVALALALVAQRARERPRPVGAVVGALSVQALLRAPDLGPTGTTALVTVVALVPVAVSAWRVLPPSRQRRVLLAAGGLAGAFAVLAVVGVIGVLSVRARVERATDASEAALAQVEAADRRGASAELRRAEADLAAATARLDAPWMVPVRAVPVVGPNVHALQTLADEGHGLVEHTRRVVDDVDYERLRYQDGGIDLDELRRAGPALARLDAAFARTEAAIAETDSPWLLPPLTERVDDYRGTLRRRGAQTHTAALAAAVAPAMLGGEGDRTWLVVFPTPAEARGGGGFVGNFAVLTTRAGRVELVASERMTTMIDARPPGERTIVGLPGYLARYGHNEPADHPQDILYSPHFPDDAAAYAQVAEQSGLGAIDGVLSLDPTALGALLRFTGPVPVPGRAEPLDEASARQWLLEDQYLAYGDDDTARTDALSALAREVFDRLTTGSLPEPRELGDVFGPLVRGGNLAVYATRADEQTLLAELGVDGALPEAGGHDLLHVSGANAANNKIDAFLERSIDVEVDRDPDTGRITSHVRITLTNRAPATGLPPYVIGNTRGLPPGTNRMVLSTFTPLGLAEVRVDGAAVGVESTRERGYRVYAVALEIPAGATTVVELDLAGEVPGMERYRLVVPAQTMVRPDRLTLSGTAPGRRHQVVLGEDRTFSGPPP